MGLFTTTGQITVCLSLYPSGTLFLPRPPNHPNYPPITRYTFHKLLIPFNHKVLSEPPKKMATKGHDSPPNLPKPRERDSVGFKITTDR